MKKQFLFYLLVSIFLLTPFQVGAKKRKKFQKRWSLSVVNAYGFHNFPNKKGSERKPLEWGDLDGPMHPFFSSLEISRNLGYYEIGAKIQDSGPAFVSPFLKWNLIKNKGRKFFIPALTFGVVPSHIMGVWLRLGAGFSLNPYISFSPFIGASAYYKLKDDAKYEKYNIHLNTGLRINLYY